MAEEYKHLTPEQVQHFLDYGYIHIKGAFTRSQAAEFTKDMWTRLGVDPHDSSTWDKERVHMPYHRRVPIAEFAPKAWEIIKELLGGEERINDASSAWGDSFIVNFGKPSTVPALTLSDEGPAARAARLDNWHVDGDFFVHFLDSPEQALLVTPVFSDIAPHGGATWIAPDSVPLIARYLASNPAGVVAAHLGFVPAAAPFVHPATAEIDYDAAAALAREPDAAERGCWSHMREVRRCAHFVELAAEVGDVVLMHPLMMHSASRNELRVPRVPRVITNPPVALRSPFVFARSGEGADRYSLVERKTLAALGVERLEWKIEGERRTVVPARVKRERAMREEERRRMEGIPRVERAEMDARVEVSVA